MSLFCCPICGESLRREEKGYLCPRGHSFDLAREGYVHLLPANRKHAREPGDDKEMAAARSRFLDGGYYAHLREALCRLAVEHTGDAPAVLDSGCGEGYYTQGVKDALLKAGKTPAVAGVDISKFCLRRAAKREKGAEWAVASAYHLPLEDERVELIVNCFSPMAREEFLRVLRPGGVLLYVVPAPEHLWELKQVLYETPYPNPEEAIPYEGFSYLDIVKTERTVTVEGQALQDLFRMTPYFWKTPKEGARRLAGLSELEVGAKFRIHVFRKD